MTTQGSRPTAECLVALLDSCSIGLTRPLVTSQWQTVLHCCILILLATGKLSMWDHECAILCTKRMRFLMLDLQLLFSERISDVTYQTTFLETSGQSLARPTTGQQYCDSAHLNCERPAGGDEAMRHDASTLPCTLRGRDDAAI